MPVTIDPQDGVVYKGVNPLLFPVDANDRVSAFLSGLDTADNPVLGRFTTDGRLKVDASVSIDSVDIGDVNMRVKLAGGGEDYLYGAMNPDGITRFLYTQDQRMSYTAGSLHVKADNFDVLLSTRATEATLSSFKTAFDGRDLATQTTLAAFKSAFDTRDLATQTTLASVDAKLNSLGQKLMAGSVPTVLASDHSDIRVTLRDPAGNPIGSVLDATGAYAIRTSVRGLGKRISTDNSSSVPLASNAEFVGAAEDVTEFADISVFAHSDVQSATDGLKIEWSSNGVNFDAADSFTILPTGTKIFTFGAVARFMRVRYKNGATAQSQFRLQTILHPVTLKSSSHRVKDVLSQENDATLVRAILAGQDVGDLMFKNVGVSNARLLVSTEQPAAPPGTAPVTVTADGSVSGSVDTFYTITNGKAITVQKFVAGAVGVVGGGAKAELYYDPNGTGIGMTMISKGFMNGNNFQFDESFIAAGNGTRRIVLRRTNVGGGSLEIYARWSGFEQ